MRGQTVRAFSYLHFPQIIFPGNIHCAEFPVFVKILLPFPARLEDNIIWDVMTPTITIPLY